MPARNTYKEASKIRSGMVFLLNMDVPPYGLE